VAAPVRQREPEEQAGAEGHAQVQLHDPAGHAAAFRTLLLFTPEAARQIPFVLADPM
jgi:hypothetical protein